MPSMPKLLRTIVPRRMNFQFDGQAPLYWFAQDQFKSILLTAFSATLPEGERFFIRSLRHYQSHITNVQLQQDVQGFIGQEAHHGREHDHFNAWMTEYGMSTVAIEQLVRRFLAWYSTVMSPERQLAKTVALEHFTAMFGEMVLLHPELFDGAPDPIRQLWLWHALEEVEHKAVAFDVYQQVVGNLWLRRSEMVINTLTFVGFYAVHYVQLQHAMQVRTDWSSVWQGLQWLLGRQQGVVAQIAPHYWAFYRRDFHPNQRQTDALIQQWRSVLLTGRWHSHSPPSSM